MGRKEFGTYELSWSPPEYSVDSKGKVVGGYTPSEPHNWGRWGSEDQRGTANYVTESEVKNSALLVRRGRVFSLALPIDETAPNWPARPPTQLFTTMSGSDVITGTPLSKEVHHFIYTDDVIQMATQGSTQWDGIAHVAVDDSFYNGYWSGSMTAMRGAETLGIGVLKTSLIGRGVLLDLARFAGVEYLEAGHAFGGKELDDVCKAQGVSVASGDIVLLRTGSLGRWWKLESDAERLDWFSGWGGVGKDSIEWFLSNEIAAGASDSVGFEVVPREDFDEPPYPLHRRLIVDNGFSIGELWELDELAEDCASDGVYEFQLVAPPLNIPRAVGSPLNPIAIK